MSRRHLKLLGVLILALSVTMALAAGDAAAKKKKKKKKAGGTVDITKVVNAPVPDGTNTPMGATATIGTLTSTIDVAGKQFKNTQIRDVNVTIQTLGASGGLGGSLSELGATVTAPNGATAWLFGVGLFGSSLGPLTIDDETPNALQLQQPPARNNEAVASPYQGTAQPYCFFARGACALSVMDNGPVTGTWTLRVYDSFGNPGNTSIVTNWRILVLAGRARLTK